MGLNGYLKTSDPGRISSVSPSNDKTRRKQILPLVRGGSKLSSRLYVRDCSDHSLGGGAVPIELFDYKPGGGWKSLGMAKVCVLCWLILTPPVEVSLPDPLPLPEPEWVDGKRKKRSPTGEAKPKSELILHHNFQAITEFISTLKNQQTFTRKDLESALDISRSQSRKLLLNPSVKKLYDVVSTGGPGRGNIALYKKRAP